MCSSLLHSTKNGRKGNSNLNSLIWNNILL
jgi:hypothetical protein